MPGLAVASPNRLLLALTLGYRLTEMAGSAALWPTQAVPALLDREGELAADPYELPDVVETTVCADAHGNVYVGHVSSLSSVYSSLTCKLGLDRLDLPLQSPIEPTGGLTLLPARTR